MKWLVIFVIMVLWAPFCMSAVSIYDFSDTVNNLAFEKNGTADSPTDYDSEADVSDYTNLAESDNNRWVTAQASADGDNDTQIYSFTIAETAGQIDNLSFSWEGYGDNETAYYTNISIWNFNSAGWEELDNNDFTANTDAELSGVITSNMAYYLNSSNHVVFRVVTKKYVVALLALGESCTLGNECDSDNCVDSVCCDTSCDSTCQACNVTLSVGTCTDAPVDTDWHDDCSAGTTADDGCQKDTCDGSGACDVFTSTDAGCPVCGTCSDSDVACEYHPEDTVDTGCAACSGCLGSEIGDCTGVLPDTNWGAGLYSCTASDARCVSGTCQDCSDNSGYLYSDGCSGCAGQGGNACWKYGASGASCTTACSSYGGCISGGWDDTDSCTVCRNFFGAGISCTSNEGFQTYHPIFRTFCYYRQPGDQSCSSYRNGGQRLCVCKY